MKVDERFLKYVSFETTSDEDSTETPSTACQLLLADYLADELTGLGLEGVKRDEYGRVYGFLPASPGCEDAVTIGLIAHNGFIIDKKVVGAIPDLPDEES